jgi:hypothetical protein
MVTAATTGAFADGDPHGFYPAEGCPVGEVTGQFGRCWGRAPGRLDGVERPAHRPGGDRTGGVRRRCRRRSRWCHLAVLAHGQGMSYPGVPGLTVQEVTCTALVGSGALPPWAVRACPPSCRTGRTRWRERVGCGPKCPDDGISNACSQTRRTMRTPPGSQLKLPDPHRAPKSGPGGPGRPERLPRPHEPPRATTSGLTCRPAPRLDAQSGRRPVTATRGSHAPARRSHGAGPSQEARPVGCRGRPSRTGVARRAAQVVRSLLRGSGVGVTHTGLRRCPEEPHRSTSGTVQVRTGAPGGPVPGATAIRIVTATGVSRRRTGTETGSGDEIMETRLARLAGPVAVSEHDWSSTACPLRRRPAWPRSATPRVPGGS